MIIGLSYPRLSAEVGGLWYTKHMNRFTQLIFTIAVVIVGVWLLALVFKLAAWLINGLLYVAAVIVIVGLISAYLQSRGSSK